MMSFSLSDLGGDRRLSAWGLSALIKRLVFRRISWFIPRGQDFSGSECTGCCAGRREDCCYSSRGSAGDFNELNKGRGKQHQ